ncbi:46 kDa FK506-binding nuclear protein [Copidosoma floridanum]|uniref:46 kDa FK506-binding nuclear protein n=1 Tax=Copidosoma floridanum TaxID=29053 RepID=UPI0006C95B99|nr:46 kDa FK506-binding nuclear protein [Copidosoma floridanum]
MLWGLIIESNKKYTQTIEQSFHISMASLNLSKSSAGQIQVSVFDHESESNYLLCTLHKESHWQQPLDLNFAAGQKISFSCNGNGHVHLTGYLIPEDDDDVFDNEMDDESEEDEDIPVLMPIEKKRKAKPENTELKKSKKSKLENSDESNEIDESDSDDGEGVMGPLSFNNESDEDDDDDDEDGEEEDNDDEEEEDEEEKKKNKTTKKPAKNQALTNGKDVQLEKQTKQQKKNKEKKDDNKVEEKSDQQQQKKKTVEGGVQIEEVRVGHGAPAKPGKYVGVYYVGRLKNGKKFDQTTSGDGFKFKLGKGEVIRGWDVGIVGMKVGGKRKIVIPPGMGYGAKGSPPVIPPNSQLIFEVELKSVN